MSDPALIEQIIRAEEISRPRYAALNLADLRTYQQGLLGMQEAATRQAGQLEREQLALQRAADIEAVEAMEGGPRRLCGLPIPTPLGLRNLANRLRRGLTGRLDR